MNNDLTKLSQKEIDEKKRKLFESADCISDINAIKLREYNQKVQRRWVNPVKLLSLQRQLDKLSGLITFSSNIQRLLPMSQIEERLILKINAY